MNTTAKETGLLLWFNGERFCVGGYHQLLKDREQAVVIKGFDTLPPAGLTAIAHKLNNSNIPGDLKRLLDL